MSSYYYINLPLFTSAILLRIFRSGSRYAFRNCCKFQQSSCPAAFLIIYLIFDLIFILNISVILVTRYWFFSTNVKQLVFSVRAPCLTQFFLDNSRSLFLRPRHLFCFDLTHLIAFNLKSSIIDINLQCTLQSYKLFYYFYIVRNIRALNAVSALMYECASRTPYQSHSSHSPARMSLEAYASLANYCHHIIAYYIVIKLLEIFSI